ncbi:alpha/beta fold hydrolase [Microbacterium terregens]|uniref:Alpha/beta fold hydrolase n=1 Tax=Microbacterium terregens TaxID=69363 RepID=A0ABV5SXV1_9MICO
MTRLETFDPDDRAIPYLDQGDGPALVLLSERGADGGGLGTLTSILVETGFRIVRIGFRGAADDVTLQDLAQDVLDVLDHLEIRDTWIGGHAFGGTVARTLALAHPDRANGVLLLGVEVAQIPVPQHMPVLVVQGAGDEITPAANGLQLQASAPGLVSVTLLEGAGHMFPVTHAGQTAEIIEEYLDWD